MSKDMDQRIRAAVARSRQRKVVFKSADRGEFVSKTYAEKHPKTTYELKVPVRNPRNNRRSK